MRGDNYITKYTVLILLIAGLNAFPIVAQVERGPIYYYEVGDMFDGEKTYQHQFNLPSDILSTTYFENITLVITDISSDNFLQYDITLNETTTSGSQDMWSFGSYIIYSDWDYWRNYWETNSIRNSFRDYPCDIDVSWGETQYQTQIVIGSNIDVELSISYEFHNWRSGLLKIKQIDTQFEASNGSTGSYTNSPYFESSIPSNNDNFDENSGCIDIEDQTRISLSSIQWLWFPIFLLPLLMKLKRKLH